MKTVLITGTSSGMGLEMAKVLLSRGFKVIGISRRATDEEALGNFSANFFQYSFDLSQIEKISSLVSLIVKEHGAPYALINNAAIGTDGLLPTMHNSEIEKLIELNITSPIVLTKYVSRSMLANREGRIINISSVVASTGYRGLSVYAASKSALIGFTRSLARDLGKRKITVNCIAPGFVETEMTSSLGDANAIKIVNRAALGRFAYTSEIAAGVEFLLSEAGAGITGTILTIDAGNTA